MSDRPKQPGDLCAECGHRRDEHDGDVGECGHSGCDLCLYFHEPGPPRIHACSVDFPGVPCEQVSHVCGELGVMADELSGDLDEINCIHCLREIAKAWQPKKASRR